MANEHKRLRARWLAAGREIHDPATLLPLDAEATAEARQDFIEERAAILEHDAGMEREAAEFLARRLGWIVFPRVQDEPS